MRLSTEASSSSRRGSVVSSGSGADELAGRCGLASTLIDGLDELELLVTDPLAIKEKSKLTKGRECKK